MRLRRRVQLLLLAFFALVAADFAFDLYLVTQRDHVQADIQERLDPAQDELANLLTALVDQETGERGYIITGREDFLQPYLTGQSQLNQSLDELSHSLEDRPALSAGVERVESRVGAWRQLGADFEITAKRAGRDADASTLVSTGTSKTLFDRARAEIEDLEDAVRAELDHERSSLESLQARLTRFRVLTLLAALLLLALGGVLLRRWITAPLLELGTAVRHVVSGGLTETIPAPGPPELAQLGRDVEAMRRHLLTEVDDASRAREALAKRGMIVLTLQEELAASRPVLPSSLRMAVRFAPAEGIVAGDWHDVIISDDGKVIVALVDVSGHGAEAGIFALRTKELTCAAVRMGLDPGEAFAWVARQLGDTGEAFLTGVLIEIDGDTGRLRYANAGHPPVLVYGDHAVGALASTGPLLGPVGGAWATAESELLPGGFLAAYSDGLVEATDDTQEEFGVDRLSQALKSWQHGDVERIADACLASLGRFSAGQRRDDMTLLLVGRGPATTSSASLPA
ncbi:MAG TPA: SpoIIE family protein phosphatase [Acidimicrobiales bacterium]|nr:SpoIIE family protein phosphatase [Acidimicrobiales bacterium]